MSWPNGPIVAYGLPSWRQGGFILWWAPGAKSWWIGKNGAYELPRNWEILTQ